MRRDFVEGASKAAAARSLTVAGLRQRDGKRHSMTRFLCQTCGVQYPDSEAPPTECPICLDERQYVGHGGQRWTSIEDLAAAGHTNTIREEESGLTSIRTSPQVGIGQRALLVRTPNGNVLWDCISYLDEATVEAVRALGGIQAIAISHPHFYASNVTWSEAFENAPIYLHASDREWCVFEHENVVHWEGDAIVPVEGVSLIHLGGHFEGAQVLHWPGGDEGRGVLLSGDTVAVVMDRRYVSFMYSYPNEIPLSEGTIRRIAGRLSEYRFNRIYGAFPGRTVFEDGNAAVAKSAERYIENLRGR